MFKFLGLIVVHVQFITISVKNASLQPRFLKFNLNDSLSKYPYYIRPALQCFFLLLQVRWLNKNTNKKKGSIEKNTDFRKSGQSPGMVIGKLKHCFGPFGLLHYISPT